jgi:hypothetical protein
LIDEGFAQFGDQEHSLMRNDAITGLRTIAQTMPWMKDA